MVVRTLTLMATLRGTLAATTAAADARTKTADVAPPRAADPPGIAILRGILRALPMTRGMIVTEKRAGDATATAGRAAWPRS